MIHSISQNHPKDRNHQISVFLNQAGIQDMKDISYLRSQLIEFLLETNPDGKTNADSFGILSTSFHNLINLAELLVSEK